MFVLNIVNHFNLTKIKMLTKKICKYEQWLVLTHYVKGSRQVLESPYGGISPS